MTYDTKWKKPGEETAGCPHRALVNSPLPIKFDPDCPFCQKEHNPLNELFRIDKQSRDTSIITTQQAHINDLRLIIFRLLDIEKES